MEKVLKYAVKKYQDRKCLGTREILADEDEEQPDGRIFKKVIILHKERFQTIFWARGEWDLWIQSTDKQ